MNNKVAKCLIIFVFFQLFIYIYSRIADSSITKLFFTLVNQVALFCMYNIMVTFRGIFCWKKIHHCMNFYVHVLHGFWFVEGDTWWRGGGPWLDVQFIIYVHACSCLMNNSFCRRSQSRRLPRRRGPCARPLHPTKPRSRITITHHWE